MKKTTMLKKNYEFRNILTKGRRYSGQYIDIYAKRNNLNENKLGIAVSSKGTNSVKRNKIKRLIRENYRLIEDELQIGNSFVILWRKNQDIKEAEFYNIKEDFEKFIKNFNK